MIATEYWGKKVLSGNLICYECKSCISSGTEERRVQKDLHSYALVVLSAQCDSRMALSAQSVHLIPQ